MCLSFTMLSSFTKFKYLMSNILIIKHGSLGDIVQISGVLKDIRENQGRKGRQRLA